MAKKPSVSPKKATAEKKSAVPKTAKKAAAPKAEKKPAKKPDRPKAIIEFLAGWTHTQTGAIVQDGELIVRYDPNRLTSCRAEQNGVPAWDLFGFALFHPGGQMYSANLVQHVDAETGKVLIPPKSIPFQVAVPQDASEVELWFQNTDVTGAVGWDSRLGENYRFGIDLA